MTKLRNMINLHISKLVALAIVVVGVLAGLNSLAGTTTKINYKYDALGQLENAVFVDYTTDTGGTYVNRSSTLVYVYDNMGNRLMFVSYTSGASANNAPGKASNPTPFNGATGIEHEGYALSWDAATDPDGDDVAYNLYFGSPTTLVWSGTQVSYDSSDRLGSATAYYWRVDTVDCHNSVTTGDDWNFTTSQYADTDGDGVNDYVDWCPDDYDPTNADADGDHIGDICDVCPTDHCYDSYSTCQQDSDGDGFGDACTVYWNVSTDAELHNALNTASGNKKNDVIYIAGEEGSGRVYAGHFSITTLPDDRPYSLLLLGGYSPDFTERDPKKYISILDGNNNGTVLFINNNLNTVPSVELIVDGLTIRNGNYTQYNDGGGLYVEWGSGYVQITNNVITYNRSNNTGGVTIIHYSGAEPLIFTGNIVTHNTGNGPGGILVSAGAISHQTYCSYNVFSNNSCIGAGMGGAGEIRYNVDFTNNIVTGNSGVIYGGGFSLSGKCQRVSGNLISGNTVACSNPGYGGGGLYLNANNNSTIDIVNNTIIGNTATGAGIGDGVLTIESGTSGVTLNIYNNIIWGNDNQDIHRYGYGSTATVNLFNNDYGTINTYSKTNMLGNIDVDPGFIDAANGYYQLDSESPLIDAGYNQAPSLPETDMGGAPRIIGQAVDIGAYEYYPDEEPPFSNITTPADGTVLTNYTTCLVAGRAFDIGYGVGDVKVLVSPDNFTNDSSIYNATDTSGDGSWSTWKYNWSIPGDGVYAVKSRATDIAGNVDYRSAPVIVRKGGSFPSSSITDPTDSETVGGSHTVEGTATAGSSAAVDHIEVSIDGSRWSSDNVISSDNWTTWEYDWVVQGTGTHTLSSRAVDEYGYVEQNPGEIQVNADTELIPGRTSVDMKYNIGMPAPSTSVNISSWPWGLDYTASSSTPWFGVSPSSGVTPSSVGILVDPSGMTMGNYTGSLVITSTDAINSPLSVPVSLAVGAEGSLEPELQHYNWDVWLTGGDCTVCHVTEVTFLPSDHDINQSEEFCRSCHNAAAAAHDKAYASGNQHPTFVSITTTGILQPTYGNVTSGEYDNRPYANLDGDKLSCVTCHNAMRKTEDYGRSWEYTTTLDRLTYFLDYGGWADYGHLVPTVYRDTTLWSGPALSKDMKDYLVDSTEYGYDEEAGSIKFSQEQDAGSYIYVTLGYPYLRASSEDDRLCSDCHTQLTHKSANCLACHSAHNSDNIAGIRNLVRPTDLPERNVVFNAYTGANSFADGDTTYDGICEVCHTQTKYYRWDGSGFANHSGNINYDRQNCTTCHMHSKGFSKYTSSGWMGGQSMPGGEGLTMPEGLENYSI